MGFEQGHDIVGKVKTFIICWIVLLESAKDQFLEVDLPPPPPKENMCPHKSGVEQLAD
jgi:hypothetical protein